MLAVKNNNHQHLVWTFWTTFCYQCKVSMVFKGTITIEWNGLGQPLGSMVFQWFWGQATIGFDGLRWLSTIGPTMEWLHTIVEVYRSSFDLNTPKIEKSQKSKHSKYFQTKVDRIDNLHLWMWSAIPKKQKAAILGQRANQSISHKIWNLSPQYLPEKLSPDSRSWAFSPLMLSLVTKLFVRLSFLLP